MFLYVAVNRDSTSENESLSELSATAETRIVDPDVEFVVPARQSVIDDPQEEHVDSLALGPSRSTELPDGALVVSPPPPDVLREAEAALSGVKDIILSGPSGQLRLESEPVDPNWAPQMESTIWSVASVAGEIRDVECRTTYCRAVLSPLESESVQGIPNDREVTSYQRVLQDAFNAIIRSSNGRLTGFSISRPPPFNEQQSDAEIVVTLSGRPIENSGSVPP